MQAVPEAPLSLARRLAQQFQGEVIRSPAASPGSFVAQLAAVAETEAVLRTNCNADRVRQLIYWPSEEAGGRSF